MNHTSPLSIAVAALAALVLIWAVTISPVARELQKPDAPRIETVTVESVRLIVPGYGSIYRYIDGPNTCYVTSGGHGWCAPV